MRVPGVRVLWRRRRWWQTVLFQLFWPAMLLGTIYVLLFFFVNSSYFAGILSSQLNGRFQGQFRFERVSLSATFDHLQIHGAILRDPLGEDVVRAQRIDVRFDPIELTKRLVNDNRLEFDDIELHDAFVYLDFSRSGSFNLSRVFLPAEMLPPEPPSPKPSTFTMGLNNVNVYDSEVVLNFGVFIVELEEFRVNHFTLGIEPELKMSTPPLQANDFAGIFAKRGHIRFDPGMFGFPMGRFGHKEKGLILGETGGGTGGALLRNSQRATAAVIAPLAKRIRKTGTEAEKQLLDASMNDLDALVKEMKMEDDWAYELEQQRGELFLELADIRVDGFWWNDARYGFERFKASITNGDASVVLGELRLGNSLMDLEPLETIGYVLNGFHLHLPADPRTLLHYFAGPDLKSTDDSNLSLDIAIKGDLGRAEGPIKIAFPGLTYGDLAIDGFFADTQIAGQRLTIDALGLNVLEAPIAVTGWMDLLDGNMDLDVMLGIPDADPDAREGLRITELLPPSQQGHFAGTVSTRLRLLQAGPRLAVQLGEPVYIDLDNPLPFSGAKRVKIAQEAFAQVPTTDYTAHPELLSLEYSVLRLHDALTVDALPESIRVGGGLTFWMNNDRVAGLDLHAEGENLGRFTVPFVKSLVGFQTGPFSLDAKISGPFSQPNGSIDVAIDNIDYPVLRGEKSKDYSVDKLRLRARIKRDVVDLEQLQICSPHGDFGAAGTMTLFDGSLSAVRSSIPLQIDTHGRNLDLNDLGWLGGQSLEGELDVDLRISGSSDAIGIASLDAHLADPDTVRWARGCDSDAQVSNNWTKGLRLSGLEIMGERIPELHTDFHFADNQFALTKTHIALGRAKPEEASISINEAGFDLNDNTFRLDMGIHALHIEDLAMFRDKGDYAALGLKGRIDLEGFLAEGDLDLFSGGRIEQDLLVRGGLRLSGLQYGDIVPPGDIDLTFKTHDEQVEIVGTLFNDFHLSARARTWQPMRAEIELSFFQLPVMDWLALFAAPIYEKRGNKLPVGPYKGYVSRAEAVTALNSVALLKDLLLTGTVGAVYDVQEGIKASVDLERLHVKLSDRVLENRDPIKITFENDTLSIDAFDIGPGDRQFSLSGSANLDGDLDLKVAGLLDISLVQLFTNAVPKAAGSLELELSAKGDLIVPDPEGEKGATKVSMDDLKISGKLEVDAERPIELAIRGLPSILRLESGRIEIDNHRVGIPSDAPLSGRVLGGHFDFSGGVDLGEGFSPGVAELVLNASGVTYNVPGMARVTANIKKLIAHVDLRKISAKARKSGKFIPAKDFYVTGYINILDGLFYKDYNIQSDFFQQQFQSSLRGRKTVERVEIGAFRGDSLLNDLALGLKIQAKESFRVNSEIAGNRVDLNIGMDMGVGGTLKELELSGNVKINSGYFKLFGHKFEVMPNSEILFDPNDSFNPSLNITAQSEINTQSNFMSAVVNSSALDRRQTIHTGDIASGAQSYILTLGITGLVSELKIMLSSVPILTENDIITLLLTGQTLAGLNASGEDNPTLDFAFDTLIAPFVEAQVGNVISADAFKFSISDGAAQLVYIQQFSDQLRIAGGISLAGASGNRQAIGGEYRIFEDLSLELTGQNESDEGLMLNLQVRWLLPLD